MAVGDVQTHRGLYEDTHLPFEGFMEALCRIAAQKALPTEAELVAFAAANGCKPDAGEYMAQVRALPWLLCSLRAHLRALCVRACLLSRARARA